MCVVWEGGREVGVGGGGGRRGEFFLRPSTLSVTFSSSLYELVHHGDSGLGSMSKFSSSSKISFTMCTNILRSD